MTTDVSTGSTTESHGGALTMDEIKADLTLEQLRQLVGLVEYDADSDVFPVMAFLTLEIRQGSGHDAVARHLAGIAEVLEAYTITGAGDMWCRVVARTNADLQRVIDQVLAHAGIDRSTTVIALATQIPHRVRPLARIAVG